MEFIFQYEYISMNTLVLFNELILLLLPTISAPKRLHTIPFIPKDSHLVCDYVIYVCMYSEMHLID